MKPAALPLGASAVILALVQLANAGITVYSDRIAFEVALSPGYWLEQEMFNKIPNYSGNGFSYTAALSSTSYNLNGDLSTGSAPAVITLVQFFN